MTEDSFSGLSLDQFQWLHSTSLEFEDALNGERSPVIEEYLERAPSELRRALLRELLACEVAWHVRSGRTPDSSSFRERFADDVEIVDEILGDRDILGDKATDNPSGASVTQADNVDPSADVIPAAMPHDRALPDRIDGYEVIGSPGRGGMGVVYAARDPKLERTVAIKMLAPELAGNRRARERFIREARAAAAIRHPNVVAIHAIVDERDPPYLVLEYVEGKTLSRTMQDTGPLPLDQVLRTVKDIAAGLDAAHARGIIHRDVKPDNILIEADDGRARLTDFGLARGTDDPGVTATGELVGTPRYMSPEQVEGRDLDERSDLFSLGAVLYSLLTGRPAFPGQGVIALARSICDRDPVPVSELRPDTPRWLQSLVDRLLEKNPENRVSSARELLQLLEGEPSTPPVRTAIPKRTAFGLLVAVASCAAVFLLRPGWNTTQRTTIRPAATTSQGSPPHTADSGTTPIGRQPESVEEAPVLVHDLLVDSGYRLGSLGADTVAVADIDNDGDPDIVVGNGKVDTPQTNQLWINDGHGGFQLSPAVFGNAITSGVAVGDVNGDDLVDIYFANWTDEDPELGRNSLWLNQGNGQFVESDQARDVGNSRRVSLGDLDGDGDADLWVSNYKESDSLWLNDGSGRFRKSGLTIDGTRGARSLLMDINLDGMLDLVLGRDQMSILVNRTDPTAIKFLSIPVPGLGPSVFFESADLNDDGFVDVAIRKRKGLLVWWNGGDGMLHESEFIAPADFYEPFGLGDLNRDGLPDIVVGTQEGPGSTMLINDGAGGFSRFGPTIPVTRVCKLRLADLDGDGDVDVFFANATNDMRRVPDQIWWNLTVDRAPELIRGLTATNMRWSRVDRLVADQNLEGWASPSVTDDGTLYFQASRDGDRVQLYSVECSAGATPEPVRIPPDDSGTPAEIRAPVVSADRLMLVFQTPAGRHADDGDLWFCRRATVDAPWGSPQPMGVVVNSQATDRSPVLSPDGLLLAFGSSRDGGYGDTDIWLSTRDTTNAPWSAPVNAGPAVNTAGNELPHQILGEPPMLVFSRTDGPSTATWMSWLHPDRVWAPPRRIATPFDEGRIEAVRLLPEEHAALFQMAGDGPDDSCLRKATWGWTEME